MMSNKISLIREVNLTSPNNSDDISSPTVSPEADVELVIGAFLAELQLMGTSRKTYGWAVIRFFLWCRNSGRPVGSLQRADIVSYIEGLATSGYSVKTIASYTVAVRRFYEWLGSRGQYPNIASGVKAPRRQKDGFVKMHLDWRERSELLEYARRKGLRDYAIINLMLRNGLRTIEVSRLDVGDVTTRRGVRILKLWRKGSLGKHDYVPLTEEALDPLEEYLSTRRNALAGSPLFVTDGDGHRDGRMSPRRIQQIVKEGLVSIGLNSRDYSPHSLRHTTAVAILENGGSIFDVQAVLGHASSTTSQIYTRSAEERMRLENPPENIIRGAFGGKDDNK